MQGHRDLDRYLRKEIHGVAGYLATIDAEAIAALGKFQSANGVKGDLCELGVHHGRLFFILAHLRAAGEKALPVDLFLDGAGNDNAIHRGRDKAFFNHLERFRIQLDDVLTANTLELKPEDLLVKIGKARIVSVDAGHLYDEVANDLRLARDILTDDGVIIADDYFNIYWPDVTTATNDFLAQNSDFAPFLITPGKLYICRQSTVELYRGFAVSFTAPNTIRARTVELNKVQLTAARLSRRGELHYKLRRWI